MRKVLALLGAVLMLAGCSDKEIVRAPLVDVDTPAVRALKAEAGIADCEKATADPAADGLPDATLPCLGGGPGVNLARLRGPLVVNLWAQWCAPCRRELPIYQQFSTKYAGRVGVLGVDWQDTQPDGALQLARETGVKYPLVADGEPAIRARGLPKLVLIDEDGAIAFEEYLEIKSLDQLEGLVEKHLGVSL